MCLTEKSFKNYYKSNNTQSYKVTLFQINLLRVNSSTFANNETEKKNVSPKNKLQFSKLRLLLPQNQHPKSRSSLHQTNKKQFSCFSQENISWTHFSDSPKLSISQEAEACPVCWVHGCGTVTAISRKMRGGEKKTTHEIQWTTQHHCLTLKEIKWTQ